MKKVILGLGVLMFSITSTFGQVVNGNDISKETDTFEVWAFKKPFTTKECLFANYGQKKFRPHYYDHKTQAIKNSEGEKFSKGEWLSLLKYLKSEGWHKVDERQENIGDVIGRVVTFERG